MRASRERLAAVKRANKRGAGRGSSRERLGLPLDPAALFDVQVKRIHEYKRQLLNLLETVALLTRRSAPIRTATGSPRVKIFAGKAAPSYAQAKLIIKLANDVAERGQQRPAWSATG